jgi:hypothetical protein
MGWRGVAERPDATADELFAAWVAEGTPTYREFAATLARQNRYKTAATALGQISRIASREKWQERKASALSTAAQAKLEEAAAIDADTFHRTSRELNRRARFTTGENLDAIVKMRESVRRPVSRVEHTGKDGKAIQHEHTHRDLSQFTDDEIEALAAMAERRKTGELVG